MEFNKEILNLRLYQQTILDTASKHNTLVVLPTGLGKTHIAIALAGLRHTQGKILMVAPTKPLVNQHQKTFGEFFSPASALCALSGDVSPEERQILWANSQIIFSTPQTIKFDVISGRINLKDVSLLIIDEAHRTAGDYAYVFVAKAYATQASNPRILALTASPGEDNVKIDDICESLFIEKIEVRNREHAEVKAYVKDIVVDYLYVDLPESFQTIKHCLETAIKKRLEELKNMRIITSADLSQVRKKNLLMLQASLQRQINTNNSDVFKALSLLASILKIYHALSLVESESLGALAAYLRSIWAKSLTSKVRAIKDVVTDMHIRIAYQKTLELESQKIEHPKLDTLKQIVSEQMSKKLDSKILIFTEYRSNVGLLVNSFESYKNIIAHKFIGQSSKADKGMSQKTQIETIDRFKKGEINVLVCTSVAEEGLDIPSVDLVIFYSPVPSVIRTIQRRGRTGRQSIGKLIVLITKDTKDERYYWMTQRKEKKMNLTINSLSNKPMQPKLNNFVALKKPEEKKLTIFADTREHGNVIDYLFENNINVKSGALKAGDFIVSEDVGIERKEIGDFVNSLLDKRLFEQAKALKESFTTPIYILEGNFSDIFTKRNVNSNAIWAALMSLILDWKIPIIFSASPKDTANILVTIAKREQLDLKKTVSARGDVKPKTLDEQQQYFIEGLPLVGPTLAKRLLSTFGTPLNVCNALTNDLQKIENLGQKKADAIKNLLTREYSDKINT